MEGRETTDIRVGVVLGNEVEFRAKYLFCVLVVIVLREASRERAELSDMRNKTFFGTFSECQWVAKGLRLDTQKLMHMIPLHPLNLSLGSDRHF